MECVEGSSSVAAVIELVYFFFLKKKPNTQCYLTIINNLYFIILNSLNITKLTVFTSETFDFVLFLRKLNLHLNFEIKIANQN